ncbi:hypothetical protein M422DRAFT_245075 [Sphaerobolus stellatus SS14]|nr:hypothetical protein M422DRAFT_245075 [Sphaerobolus stellatus SS14]
MLAGQKFFERMEVKDILAYLQLIDNPNYTPAFVRASQVPSRGIGEKTIAGLTAKAKTLGLSSGMELAERIHAGTSPDLKPAIKGKLATFITPILSLRKMANEGAAVSALIRRLLVLIGYETHLKKNNDWEMRWENIQELINYATQFEKDASSLPSTQEGILSQPRGEVIDLVSDDAASFVTSGETALQAFLQASMLSTDTETKDADPKAKVTITTCHSAKGLEWPVVFIPAAEKGIYPFYRTDDTGEERRLLYVGCTRAQGILYVSHVETRSSSGRCSQNEVSPFVAAVPKSQFSSTLPVIMKKERGDLATVLRRTLPDDKVIQEKISE